MGAGISWTARGAASRARGAIHARAPTIYLHTLGRVLPRIVRYDLIARTGNFTTTSWLGTPIWQKVLDAWTIQETLAEVRPALLVEVGTYRGGSALYYANIFELLGHGRVLTIDVTDVHEREHERIRFLHGTPSIP